MKYLLLVYRNEPRLEAMSTNERDTFAQACLANKAALQKSGRLLATAYPHSSVITVQRCDGKISITDGPIAATAVPIVGCFFIDGRDLNDAIGVAAQMPQALVGSIEVWSMLSFAA